MKKISFFLAVFWISATGGRAQCPMSCDSESFPYIFCTLTGHQITKCSKNPNNELPLVAAKSYMPGCVNVIPIDASLDFQPAGPVPVEDCGPEPIVGSPDTDRQAIFDQGVGTSFELVIPWEYPYDEHQGAWG